MESAAGDVAHGDTYAVNLDASNPVHASDIDSVKVDNGEQADTHTDRVPDESVLQHESPTNASESNLDSASQQHSNFERDSLSTPLEDGVQTSQSSISRITLSSQGGSSESSDEFYGAAYNPYREGVLRKTPKAELTRSKDFDAWRVGGTRAKLESLIHLSRSSDLVDVAGSPTDLTKDLVVEVRGAPSEDAHHLDFDTPGSVRTPMPTPGVGESARGHLRTRSLSQISGHITHVSHQILEAGAEILEAGAEIRAKTAGKEGEWSGAVYNVVWWFCYIANVVSLFVAVFGRPWRAAYLDTYHIMIPLVALGLVTSILIADISSDFICIALATLCPSQTTKKVSCEPMERDKARKFLVIYCLKSNEKTDILETLSFLKASWRVNQSYRAARYCILSGTQDPVLSEWEKSSIKQWNENHAHDGIRCYYVRRTRSVLHKYGQYLDFIMLMNGYLEPMLYRDVVSRHPSGHCFDPSGDVTFFRGSDFEFLCVMDRDNMLSPKFFDYANRFFEAYPDLQILQPAITPFPKFFRRLLDTESWYTSLAAKFQILGNELAEYKRVFIPSAAFYGKGIIRRSAYNETLLGWNPATGETCEEKNIPRDLLSHDIIESSVMKTMLAPEIAVYEDFPLSHVEWHLRQGRWDLGDLIISKYLYPFSFGLMPNILCWFSYSFVRPFYQSFSRKMGAAIYSSTYNLRCILMKPIVVLSMIVYIFIETEPPGAYILAVFINVQIIIIPICVIMLLVKGLSWKEKVVLQLYTMYMGVCDIYYGTFRTLRAAYKIYTQKNKWATFKALNHSPFTTMLIFCKSVQVELSIAAMALISLLYFKWGAFTGAEYAIIAYICVILTFPLYTYTTAFKKTGDGAGKDEGVNADLKDALFEIIDESIRLHVHLYEPSDTPAVKLHKEAVNLHGPGATNTGEPGLHNQKGESEVGVSMTNTEYETDDGFETNLEIRKMYRV